jgi:hypothetical protein
MSAVRQPSRKEREVIQVSFSICIDAPVALVWEHMARLEEIALWSDTVRAARLVGPLPRGVGAERVCEVAGNLTVHERWLEWDEGRSFTYEAIGAPLIKRATNRWSVRPEGKRSLLTSDAQVELKGGPWSRPLEPVAAIWIRRVGPQALAGFKYLVEHGHPYQGRPANLPPAPAGC